MVGDKLTDLRELLGPQRFRISREFREELEQQLGVDTESLVRLLVQYVKSSAVVPVSKFEVGTAGLTEAGEVFLGFNLEFPGASLAQTIHAEQFVVSWARACSSSRIRAMAVSAPPCGHCRQFVCEFDPEGELKFLIGDEQITKASVLLPRAFTPHDLNVTEPFFSHPLDLDGLDDLEVAARRAAELSYVPYSKNKAGVAIRAKSGKIFAGSSIENVAYNPALPPLQAALVAAAAGGVLHEQMAQVVLCQEQDTTIDYVPQSKDLALSLGVKESDFCVTLI